MPVNASEDLSWQGKCELPPHMLREDVQVIPPSFTAEFQTVLKSMFRCEDLSNLHEYDHGPVSDMPPCIYHARIQAKMDRGASKHGKEIMKLQDRAWKNNSAFKEFLSIYRRFVFEFVLPQFGGDDILYQAVPILRVVFPGSVPPCKLHTDADYWHDSNELNFWVPLVPVADANSLWAESEPGKGDFHSFDIDGSKGELMRFYGNRCRHYTTENTASTCRVSFDFRVIPSRLIKPMTAGDVDVVRSRALRGAKPLLEGGYYLRMSPTQHL